MKLLEFAVAFCTIAAAFAPAASATTLPFTGVAERGLIGGGWGIFELSGPGFYATSHGEGNDFLASCTDGLCAITASAMFAIDVPLPGVPDFGWSMGSLDGKDANFLRGRLVFPEYAKIPVLPPTAVVTALGLYPFYGDLTGFFEGPDGVAHELFTVQLAGQARLQMATYGSLSRPAPFRSGTYELTGTATPTPAWHYVLLRIALAIIVPARHISNGNRYLREPCRRVRRRGSDLIRA